MRLRVLAPPFMRRRFHASRALLRLFLSVRYVLEYLSEDMRGEVRGLSPSKKFTVMSGLCNSEILLGDMLTSNSPLDVTFFNVHAEVTTITYRTAAASLLLGFVRTAASPHALHGLPFFSPISDPACTVRQNQHKSGGADLAAQGAERHAHRPHVAVPFRLQQKRPRVPWPVPWLQDALARLCLRRRQGQGRRGCHVRY